MAIAHFLIQGISKSLYSNRSDFSRRFHILTPMPVAGPLHGGSCHPTSQAGSRAGEVESFVKGHSRLVAEQELEASAPPATLGCVMGLGVGLQGPSEKSLPTSPAPRAPSLRPLQECLAGGCPVAMVQRTGPPGRQLPSWLPSLSHTTRVSVRATQLLVSLCPQRPSTYLHKTLWNFPFPPFPYPERTETLAVLSPFQLLFFTASETRFTKVEQLRTGEGRGHGLSFLATWLHSRRKKIMQKWAWLVWVRSFTPKAWVSLTGAEHLLTCLPVLGSGSFGRMDRKTGWKNRQSWCCSRQRRLCPWSRTSSRWAEQAGR